MSKKMKEFSLSSLPKPLLVLLSASAVLSLVSVFILMKLFNINKEFNTLSSEPVLIQNKEFSSGSTIFVDIQGAVTKPGVFELPESSRMIDALQKSEGFTDNADRYYVAKIFNLAKKLTDEEKIYIPFLEERQTYISDSIAPTTININSASQTQLELLPKIGPTTAKKIINKRPYNSLEELVTKKAIGEKTLEAIKNQISL
ncbi:MAG: helix-hairpin-helix domain-containing protein [Patescibacteria group bacterium]